MPLIVGGMKSIRITMDAQKHHAKKITYAMQQYHMNQIPCIS